MKHLDKRLPNDIDKLKEIASKTDNLQMKRSIEDRIKKKNKDNTVNKW